MNYLSSMPSLPAYTQLSAFISIKTVLAVSLKQHCRDFQGLKLQKGSSFEIYIEH